MVRVTYIGGPTALPEFGGRRLLTDPTFDPAGSEYPTPVYVLRKTQSPAVAELRLRSQCLKSACVTSSVSRDGVRLLLSGEGSSGKRPLADGQRQVPGGWNRMHLEVSDLEAEVKRLRAAGVPFRTSDIVTGPGGAQVIIEDPSTNPIELFQPKQ